MYAAINQWQKLSQKNLGAAAIGLFKAQLWLMANRPDKAWIDLAPLAELEVRSEAVLMQLIQIALNIGDDEKIRTAMNYLALLKEIYAKRPGADLVALQILEANLLDRRNEKGDGQRP